MSHMVRIKNDHIKTHRYIRCTEKTAYIIRRAPAYPKLFPPIYCFLGKSSPAILTSFHFHKNKNRAILGDDIDLAKAVPIISFQYLIAR